MRPFDSDKVKEVFERISLLVHGICTVIATATMEYSNDQVIKIVQEALFDTTNTKSRNGRWGYGDIFV